MEKTAIELFAVRRYRDLPRRRVDEKARRALIERLRKAGILRQGPMFSFGPPLGSCKLCMEGRRFQFAVTYACNIACSFCPRRDSNFAPGSYGRMNVESEGDLVARIRRTGARSCSIAGGEPLLALGRTLRYVRLLRREFGPSLGIDVYTNGLLADRRTLQALSRVGVDGLRFNLAACGYGIDRLREAMSWGFQVGAEIPIIPKDRPKAERAILELDRAGVPAAHLHQLLFERDNIPALLRMGLRREARDGAFPELAVPVWGSEEAAFRLLLFAARRRLRRLSVQYCSYAVKTRCIEGQARFLGLPWDRLRPPRNAALK